MKNQNFHSVYKIDNFNYVHSLLYPLKKHVKDNDFSGTNYTKTYILKRAYL